MDISKGLVLFDGLRGHEVDDFEGQRYSLVWFSAGKFWTMTQEQKVYLRDCGFTIPDTKDLGAVSKLLVPPRGYTRCKSITSMFGMKDTHASSQKTLQWFAPPNAEQEASAQKLISTFGGGVNEWKAARAAESAVKMVKFKTDVPEEQVEAHGSGDEESSIANMPRVNYGPLDQVMFGKKEEAPAKQRPQQPVPTSPPTKRTTEDLPQFELSGEKKRMRLRRFRESAEEGSQTEAGVSKALDLSSPEYQPQQAKEAGQRSTLSFLVNTLEMTNQGSGSAVPLTNYFRLTLFTADDPQQRVCDVLALLAPPVQLSQAALNTAVMKAFGHEDSRQLLQRLQDGTRPSRHLVLRALGHAFALTRPPCRADGRSAMPREFPSMDVRHAFLVAMERAVLLGFGDMGGSCEEFVAILMADCQPNQVYARCVASCGTPILPMQPERAESADTALLRMTGSAVALEVEPAGTRVQIHKLGDCIALYGPNQQDVASSFSDAEIAAVRAALTVKACVVEAVLRHEVGASAARLVAFDCLWLSGRSLTRQSLQTRREALVRTVRPCGVIELVSQEVFSIENPPTSGAVAALVTEAVSRGCTGLLVKSLDGEYQAGLTSASWLAVAPAHA